MKSRDFLLISLLLIPVVLLPISGCVTPNPSPPVTDYATLLSSLQDSGASVKENGEVVQDFFTVKGKVISINGSNVQVFEYNSPEAMESDASLVHSDGSTFTTSKNGSVTTITIVDWIAPPHFFKTGRIISIYIGDDKAILRLLEDRLSAQFAGS